MIRPSSAPVASLAPSTLQPTHVTLALWYTILSTTTTALDGSQTSTSRFASHVASRVPSGEYAHAVTSPLCRVSVPPRTNEKEGRGSEPAPPDSEPTPPDSEPAPASRATTEKRRTAPSLHPTATSRPSPRTQTLVGSRLIRPESASAVDATCTRVPRVPRVPSKVHAITPSPVATATRDPASSAPIERGCAGSFKLEPSPSTYDESVSIDATRIQSSNPAVTRYLPRTHTAPMTADVCPGPRTFATHPSPSRHRRICAPPPIAESEAENASPELLHTASAPIGLG
mmetsp:Transcript_4933/g.22600  ORF Transcript_4933/g.22600 Transcript_4933/m.22600 type:complete len:286 (-) Transcript_4933:1130-1987(-)